MSHLRHERASLFLVGRQMRLRLTVGITRVQFSDPIKVLNNDLQDFHVAACFPALWNSVHHPLPAVTEFTAKKFDAISGVGD